MAARVGNPSGPAGHLPRKAEESPRRDFAPMRRAINAESPGEPFSGSPGDSREEMGGDLLSRLSRQYHRRGRA